MMAEKLQLEVTPPKGLLAAALTLFVIAIACPIVCTVIIASDAPRV